MNLLTLLRVFCYAMLLVVTTVVYAEEKTKVVLVAGKQSHGWGAHEHRAGCMILADRLNNSGLGIEAVVVTEGWPSDNSVFEGADTIVVYADGWTMHPLKPNIEYFDELAKNGVGLVTIHWATEVQRGPLSEKFLEWQGGFCDVGWSVNPHWDAEFSDLPDHPITNGVTPFMLNDEWYYHMRFIEGLKEVTPILTGYPDESTLVRPDGPRSGNPDVRESVANGEGQVVAWAYERPTGGRGFGFTGGHKHANWGHDDFRKVVLNAICWTAGVEVPVDGVPSPTPSREELDKNQDERKPSKRR